MNNKKIFENYLTNHYTATDKTDFTDRNAVIGRLTSNQKPLDYNLGHFFRSNVRSTSKILDLGCGYGSFLFFLKSHGFTNVVGVDISEEEIRMCKEMFPSYSLQLDDIHHYIRSTSDRFDVIYLSHVLEHIHKDELFEFLEQIKRILTDDGFFIIVVPNSAAYFNAAANRYGDLTHELGFTEMGLRQLFKVAEFRHIEIRNFFGVGTIWLNIIRKGTLFVFELFIQVLGYDKQTIYTPSIVTIVKK